jgi:muramoyltetrapeptide carboxypeptidase
MILCARGGYGSLRIIDKLDFSHFVKKPKWIAGFSDITVFHAHLLSLFDIESIHGTMPLYFEKAGHPDLNLETLIKAVTGEKLYYQVETHPLNRPGEATGVLVGGNAAMLASMSGSRSQISTEGKILFLEDVGEKFYRLDRIMITLKRAGFFDQLAGLVVGTLSEMEDDPDTGFGMSVEEIVLDAVSGFNFPVCFGFPAGHTHLNRALIMGREAKLNVSDTSTLEFIQK